MIIQEPHCFSCGSFRNKASENHGFTLGSINHGFRRNIDNGFMDNIISAFTCGTIDSDKYPGSGIRYYASLLHSTIYGVAKRYGITLAVQTMETVLINNLYKELVSAFSGGDYNENASVSVIVRVSNNLHTRVVRDNIVRAKEQLRQRRKKE